MRYAASDPRVQWLDFVENLSRAGQLEDGLHVTSDEYDDLCAVFAVKPTEHVPMRMMGQPVIVHPARHHEVNNEVHTWADDWAETRRHYRPQ